MEIKVLGTGCAGCKALYETTKQAIFELGCDVVLIKEEDSLVSTKNFLVTSRLKIK